MINCKEIKLKKKLLDFILGVSRASNDDSRSDAINTQQPSVISDLSRSDADAATEQIAGTSNSDANTAQTSSRPYDAQLVESKYLYS